MLMDPEGAGEPTYAGVVFWWHFKLESLVLDPNRLLPR